MYLTAFFEKNFQQVPIKPKTCYVLMPPGEEFREVYTTAIVGALEDSEFHIECQKAPSIYGATLKAHEILRTIMESEFVIADVTGRDPGVMFLLGLAVLGNSEVILLTQQMQDVPFDFSRYQCLEYFASDTDLAQLAQQLYEIAEKGATKRTSASSPEIVPEPENTDTRPVDNRPPVPRKLEVWESVDTLEAGPDDVKENEINRQLQKAFEFKKLGMYDEALELFDEVLASRKDDGNLHMILGDIYDEMGRHDEAIRAFNESVKLNPNNFNAFSGLGIVYAKKKQYYDAINAYAEAIRINPNNASVLSNLGAAYNALNLFDEALQAFQKALTLNPDSAQIHLNIGNAYFYKGMYPEAISAFEEALRIHPGYGKAKKNLDRAIAKKVQLDVEG